MTGNLGLVIHENILHNTRDKNEVVIFHQLFIESTASHDINKRFFGLVSKCWTFKYYTAILQKKSCDVGCEMKCKKPNQC